MSYTYALVVGPPPPGSPWQLRREEPLPPPPPPPENPYTVPVDPSEPFEPEQENPETEEMARCGQSAGSGATPSGSNIDSANALSGSEINATPGIVSTFERLEEQAAATLAVTDNGTRAETKTGLQGILASIGADDVPPWVLVAVLVLAFLALRK